MLSPSSITSHEEYIVGFTFLFAQVFEGTSGIDNKNTQVIFSSLVLNNVLRIARCGSNPVPDIGTELDFGSEF